MTDQITPLSEYYDKDGFDAEFDALPSASVARSETGHSGGSASVARSETGHSGGSVGDRPQQEAVTQRLGMVIGGSLSQGLEVRLEREVSTEELAVGSYAVVRGQSKRFFSMITDVQLGAASEEFMLNPPDMSDDFLAAVHRGVSAFGLVHLSPMLALDDEAGGEPRPVKTVPGHFSPVRPASQEEVSEVFGAEGYDPERDAHFFHVGQPLEMTDVKVTLSLERLVERSSGVFGKSGTGKTFLSRLLLAGIIKEGVAVNLIFDMHNEYGWEGSSEGATSKVKALKQIFPDGRVKIFTLDDESSRRRGSNPDHTVTIGYDQVEPDDLEMLQGILNLSEPQVGAIYALHRHMQRAWLANFLSDEWLEQQASFDPETGKSKSGLQVLAEETNQPFQTLAALRRRLLRFERYGFLKPKALDDSVERILRHLDAKTHIVLEFGRYGNMLDAYIFVANFLTRRLHQKYVEKKENAFGNKAAEPTPLVITIEEAHKFLDPQIAGHTIFGTIARELRKYNVTLFIVDQRPSQIDPEVMSQIGTRVTALLDEENDIRAVLMGVSGAAGLKEVLARLETRQQALILGHAVPMPVVVQTRSYDLAFYKAMGFIDEAELPARLADNVRKMRGDADFQGFD